MTMINKNWAPVGDTNVHYRKADSMLEMMRLSPAFVAMIVFLSIWVFIELVLLLASLQDPDLWAIIYSFLVLFIIAPSFSLPWIPCKNHLIVDNTSGKLEILKKNVKRRVISRNTYDIRDILDIIIRLDNGYQNSSQYILLLKIEHKGEVRLFSSYLLSNVRSIEVLLRSHLKNLVMSMTHIECSDMTIPIYTGDGDSRIHQSETPPLNQETVLSCEIDHSVIEGLVYACPSCHAMLCNACTTVHVARSLGCPRCGRPVLASGTSNETKLLEIADDHDENYERI
ncbi:MAG TPA: hypothetical protein VKM55_01345 [Candidatus Lokiarchaeia archaeon]|nr:hypothetical protein [Candidatus Lokiarchaeia archaeon]